MIAGLEPAELPPDAIEVARITGAWGLKGWFKLLAHSADPKALFSSKRWYLLPSERGARAFEGSQLLRVREAKEHADSVVASAHDVADRDMAQALAGARVFVARSSFPTARADEFYWVDLIGLGVINREGEVLGTVRELLSTGAQTVLVIEVPVEVGSGAPRDRMIPFVAAFVDEVDLAARRITVDWQPDYD
ncbi:MAG: ribosome maturation factor RimM [Burkholderiaceae bacterium]